MADHIKLALTMDNGTAAVMTFVTEGRSPTLPFGAQWIPPGEFWSRPPTDANVWAELHKACPEVNQLGMRRPTVLSYAVITDAEIPADRAYRNAWEVVGGRVVENLAKARELHRDKLRRQRTELLLPLDIAWSRAMATGDKAAASAVEAERQQLRDAPDDPRIESAQSIDELKLITLQ